MEALVLVGLPEDQPAGVQPAERGDYYHLYINGQYWGLFNTAERPEASYGASYFGGKPTKNKRPDLRRPIGVGVSAPVVVDAATLGGHLPTRVFLMNRVIEARKHLGLPELAAFELPERTEGKDADDADSGADARGSEPDRR